MTKLERTEARPRGRKAISLWLSKVEADSSFAARIAADFWAEARRSYEDVVELLLSGRGALLTLIEEGLLRADEDLIALAEEHEWLRDRVASVIGSMGPDELERVMDALIQSGLERSSVGRRISYRLRRLGLANR